MNRETALDTKAVEPDAYKLRILAASALQRLLRPRTQEDRDLLLGLRESPSDLLAHLLSNGQEHNAAILLAHALPEREAVWWGCMCVAATRPAGAPDAERRAVEAAEAWVWQPQDAGRAETAIAASRACADLSGGWLGLAIAWSRSLHSIDAGYGRGIEGAVLRAARRGGVPHQSAAPELQRMRLRRFVASGVAISRGEAGRIAVESSVPPLSHSSTSPGSVP